MCSISGPNGSFSLGAGAGDAEGGISVVMTEDKSTMTIGADGSVMACLHAAAKHGDGASAEDQPDQRATVDDVRAGLRQQQNSANTIASATWRGTT
jgi:hypothetical protein